MARIMIASIEKAILYLLECLPVFVAAGVPWYLLGPTAAGLVLVIVYVLYHLTGILRNLVVNHYNGIGIIHCISRFLRVVRW